MDAKELFHADGKSAGVYYCSNCRRVALERGAAESCCEPSKCETCGRATEKHWLICNFCRTEKEAAQEANLFAKAEKRSDYSGPVFAEGYNADGFFESVEDFLDYLVTEEVEGDDWPTYCWAASGAGPDIYTVEEIIEHALDEMYEGAEASDFVGQEGLQTALDNFAQENSKLVSYSPNYKVAVLLPTKDECDSEESSTITGAA